MADWTHLPNLGYKIERDGPRVHKHKYEDGVSVRIEKSATVKRRFIGVFRFKLSEAKAPLDFLQDTMGLDTTKTILTNDPKAADPATEEATVYLEALPEPYYVAPRVVEWESVFEEA